MAMGRHSIGRGVTAAFGWKADMTGARCALKVCPVAGRICADETVLARRNRVAVAGVVVEAFAGFFAEPSGLDIFYQQRAGAVF